MRDFQFGFSIYNQNFDQKPAKSLALGAKFQAQYLFTSLHIPEEDPSKVRANLDILIEQAHGFNYKIVADISSQTLENWSMSLSNLANLPIDYWRLDYGFNLKDVVELSQTKGVALNASTITLSYLQEFEKLKGNFANVLACHNFYPKPYSGLSLEYIKKQNQMCQNYGIKTMAFIAGDGPLRGPVYAGLPTVEQTRKESPLYSALQLFFDGDTDIVLVGDPGLSPESMVDLAFLQEGIIRLEAKLEHQAKFLYDQVLQERMDSSPYVIRSVNLRGYAQIGPVIAKEKNAASGKKGSIRIGNEKFGRYSGDIEICRQDIEEDDRQNQLGFVCLQDLPLLPYIKAGVKYILVEEVKKE